MKSSILVYCYCCGTLQPREMASVEFRTGFYRNIYPLAFCILCASKVESSAAKEPVEGNELFIDLNRLETGLEYDVLQFS